MAAVIVAAVTIDCPITISEDVTAHSATTIAADQVAFGRPKQKLITNQGLALYSSIALVAS